MDNIYRINFNDYFFTPYPFIILIVIGLLEGIIASRLINKELFNKRIIIIILISNIAGFFGEYYCSILLNKGYTLLVWIPWVNVISGHDLFDYLISFPLIFIVTVLIEYLINWTLLKGLYKWKLIFRTTLIINIITWILLIIAINCIAFNRINGLNEREIIEPPIQLNK